MGAEHFRLAIPRYVDMHLAGQLLLEEMVSSRIGLADIDDAFASMEAGRALRDLVVF
jgi:Zn-dependent alcohol dehydrogenase